MTADKKSSAPCVRLLANLEDEATGKAYNVYRIRKVGGETMRLELERSAGADNRQLCKALFDANADLPSDHGERTELINGLMKAQPKRLWRTSAHLGWRSGNQQFVTRTSVIGNVPGQGRKLQPPLWSRNMRHEPKTAGTLESWQRNVGSKASCSSTMIVCIAAAFAAPLVSRAGLQPFILSLCGQAKIGKSSSIMMGASVIGLGAESDLPKWDSTDSGITELRRLFNDQLLIIDETGAMEGTSADAFKRLRSQTFQYASGADKTRNSKSGFATAAGEAKASGILLMSTEHSFEEYARKAGQTRVAGEHARVIDLPALLPGHETVIDRFPPNVDDEAKAEWARGRMQELRKACAEHHGTAFPAFIERLIAKGEPWLEAKLRGYVLPTEMILPRDGQPEAMRHAAKNMGLVLAGGMIAIELGVWPIKLGRLMEAVLSVFGASLKASPSPLMVEEQSGRDVLKRIKAIEIPDKTDVTDPSSATAFSIQRNGERFVCIDPAEFRSWLGGDNGKVTAALKWLYRNGRLVVTETARQLPAELMTVTAATTFEKFDRTSHRFIKIKATAPSKKRLAA